MWLNLTFQYTMIPLICSHLRVIEGCDRMGIWNKIFMEGTVFCSSSLSHSCNTVNWHAHQWTEDTISTGWEGDQHLSGSTWKSRTAHDLVPAHLSGLVPAHLSGLVPAHLSGLVPAHLGGLVPAHLGGLVPAHLGGPGETAVKRVCCCCYCLTALQNL